MSQPHIHFYSRKRFALWPEINTLNIDDIPKNQSRFRMGIDVWVIQTYLSIAEKLRSKGFRVTIGSNVPKKSIVVAHRDDLNKFFSGMHNVFIVGIRADRSPVLVADVEVHQNDLNLRSTNQVFIPLWSQPGLIQRDSTRNSNLTRMAYFGRKDSLPSWLASSAFLDSLSKLGVEFEVRHKDWNDYSNVDVMLAHRIEAPTMLMQKPATKLYNAWLAGVPALLSPEPSYCSLRKSEHDFIEVITPDDVIAELQALKTHPEKYDAMRKQGAIRGTDFTNERIASQWVELFTGLVVEQYKHWSNTGKTGWLRYVRRLMQQKHASNKFKQLIAKELASMNASESILES